MLLQRYTVVVGIFLWMSLLQAADIVNSAVLHYQYNAIAFQVRSNIVKDTIIGGSTPRIADLDIQCRLSAPLTVVPGEEKASLPFLVENTGASTLTLRVVPESNTTYRVDRPTVYADANGNNVYDSADVPIHALTLPSGNIQILFFVGDIPSTATWRFSANGVTLIDDNASLTSSGRCLYEIENNTTSPTGVLKLTKAATISSNRLYKGSVIHYSVNIVATGGTVTDVSFSDAIPFGTTYVSGSTKLDGKALNDRTVYRKGTIVVRLPNMKKGDTHRVEFSVRVNR